MQTDETNHHDSASSSDVPHVINRSFPRLPSPIESIHDDRNSDVQIVENVAAGNAGVETTRESDTAEKIGNDAESDVFEFHGSDGEIYMGPIGTRSTVRLPLSLVSSRDASNPTSWGLSSNMSAEDAGSYGKDDI